MAAAEHGADFKEARDLRRSMSSEQLHDFAATPERNLPAHAPRRHRMAGSHDGLTVTEHHRGRKR